MTENRLLDIDRKKLAEALFDELRAMAEGHSGMADEFMVALLDARREFKVQAKGAGNAGVVVMDDDSRFSIFGLILIAKTVFLHFDITSLKDEMSREFEKILDRLEDINLKRQTMLPESEVVH